MYRLALLGLVVTGCLGGGVGYTASVSNVGYGPDLVYVANGVQVIADYDEPIFYADNFYWRWDGFYWYRSSLYNGGWVYATPPHAVLQIGPPRNYVHYRPHGWTPRNRPAVRDHRPPPKQRDHRR